MNRIVWMCVAVALAGCDPKAKGVTTPPPRPGSGSGSGSAVATQPPLDRAVCTPVRATTVEIPGAAFIREGGRWMMRLQLDCGFDRDQLSQLVTACSTQNGCGGPIDATGLAALNGELGAARVMRAMVGGVQMDAFVLPGSTLYSFHSADDLMTGARNLRAGSAPGPGGGGPRPTGGAAAPAAANLSIPCCPGCGRCIPADCGTSPPPPTRVLDDGCDDQICAAFTSPPENCWCYDHHCR